MIYNAETYENIASPLARYHEVVNVCEDGDIVRVRPSMYSVVHSMLHRAGKADSVALITVRQLESPDVLKRMNWTINDAGFIEYPQSHEDE